MTKIYGYARVSSMDQNEERQLTALYEMRVPMENIFVDLVLQILSFVALNERVNIKNVKRRGLRWLRQRGGHMGRTTKKVLDNFPKLMQELESKSITLNEVLKQCDMAEVTFYRQLKEYRCSIPVQADRVEIPTKTNVPVVKIETLNIASAKLYDFRMIHWYQKSAFDVFGMDHPEAFGLRESYYFTYPDLVVYVDDAGGGESTLHLILECEDLEYSVFNAAYDVNTIRDQIK